MISNKFEFLGEAEQEALELEPVFTRRAPQWTPLEFEGPIFDVACAACGVADCRPRLRQAVLEAIKLANNAARKLELASKLEPSKRGPDAKETARLFRAFFCHDPSLQIQGNGKERSGLVVAKRFRSVANELDGGRRITFVCLPARTPCPDADFTCCTTTQNAWSVSGDSTVRLCPPFWTDPHLPGLPVVDFRAAIIIHEMLHVLFGRTGSWPGIGDLNDIGKRGNAHCYEAFVLRVNGFGADPDDVRQCGLC